MYCILGVHLQYHVFCVALVDIAGAVWPQRPNAKACTRQGDRVAAALRQDLRDLKRALEDGHLPLAGGGHYNIGDFDRPGDWFPRPASGA